MFDNEDLPKTKQLQTFPRKLEGMSVTHMKDYRVELLVEIARVDEEIDSRGGIKAQAESLFKK